MAMSKFMYNKKRKHYSYIYGQEGNYRKNILLSTKPQEKFIKRGKEKVYDNISIFKHPKHNCVKKVYLINRGYLDHKDSFENVKGEWNWDKNDKRKVKHIKRKYRFKNKKK